MERRFSDGAMERLISRCRDGTMDFAMSRWSDDFSMVDVIAICETYLTDFVEDAICPAEPGLIEV